jgi:hypothetical protein
MVLSSWNSSMLIIASRNEMYSILKCTEVSLLFFIILPIINKQASIQSLIQLH